MASRIARKEWMRGLPSAIGEGRYERKLVHSASERSVGYVFLIEESVQNHPNPHPYQTGSKRLRLNLHLPAQSPLEHLLWKSFLMIGTLPSGKTRPSRRWRRGR